MFKNKVVFYQVAACLTGYFFYVVIPFALYDGFIDAVFISSYISFYTSSIIVFLISLVFFSSRHKVYRIPTTYPSFLIYLAILLKFLVILYEIPFGILLTGSRDRYFPLILTSIIDLFFIFSIIIYEIKNIKNPNKILIMLLLFLLLKCAELILIDGSRRGLLLPIISIILFSVKKLSLARLIQTLVLATLGAISLLIYGNIRNIQFDSISYDSLFTFSTNDIDFFNILSANIETINYYSYSSDLNYGLNFIKPFFFGLLSFVFQVPPPASVFVADKIYSVDGMTINPGLLGESFINFGPDFYFLALFPLFLFFIFNKYVSSRLPPTCIGEGIFCFSFFLIWRGQFENCFYLTVPCFLVLIFLKFKLS
jgi:hypothetical protein